MISRTRLSVFAFVVLLLLVKTNVANQAQPNQSDIETQNRLLANVKEAERSGPKSARLVDALEQLGDFHAERKRYAEAEKAYSRAFDVAKKALGPKDVKAAALLNKLARLNQDQSKHGKAESLYIKAIEILDTLEDPEHPEMTRALHSLVEVLVAQGKDEMAENVLSATPVYYRIKGSVANKIYTSIHEDFTVAIPDLMKPGAMVRDEEEQNISLVSFTDSFGTFYCVTSINNAEEMLSLSSVLNLFKEARDVLAVETERGQEMRFMFLVRGGAQLRVRTPRKNTGKKLEWDEKIPDLLTANSIFVAGKRIYQVIAGVTLLELLKPIDEKEAAKTAREQLENLLRGLKIKADK